MTPPLRENKMNTYKITISLMGIYNLPIKAKNLQEAKIIAVQKAINSARLDFWEQLEETFLFSGGKVLIVISDSAGKMITSRELGEDFRGAWLDEAKEEYKYLTREEFLNKRLNIDMRSRIPSAPMQYTFSNS